MNVPFKVVLIHGYIHVTDIETYLSEPLGLICLASYLDSAFGSEVKTSILDLYALGAKNPTQDDGLICLGISDPDKIEEELKKLQPDLIGIHCNFTSYAQDSLDLAQIVKERLPNVPIVIGGAHPTMEGVEVMNACPVIDYCARGEGEKTLADLVRHLRGEIPIEAVDGLLYRKNSEIVPNNARTLIKDLDELPIPDRRFVDMKMYSYFNEKTIWYVKNKPVATIMTSRGCPYDCVFCSTKVVWTRKWRYRSLEKVFAEIRYLHDTYGIKEFVINDDQFMTRWERISEFCDYFIQAKLGITFAVDSGISVWLVDEELLMKMRKAGFYSLRFPIESGSKKTIKYVNKPVDLDKAKILIETASRLGFWTSSNIIIGFPNETREDVLESIQYVYDSSLDFTSFIIAKPHAGSEMYEDFKRDGLLETALVRSSDFYSSDYDTNFLTATELREIAGNASANWFMSKMRFYMKPRNFFRYFLPKIKRIPDFLYCCKVAFVVLDRKIIPIVKSKLENVAFKVERLPANRRV